MKYSSASMRMWSRLGPSGSLGAAAMEIGNEYENAVFVTADMTFTAGLERFKNNFPDRIYDLGIAEQNLIGVSAGLARRSLRRRLLFLRGFSGSAFSRRSCVSIFFP